MEYSLISPKQKHNIDRRRTKNEESFVHDYKYWTAAFEI